MHKLKGLSISLVFPPPHLWCFVFLLVNSWNYFWTRLCIFLNNKSNNVKMSTSNLTLEEKPLLIFFIPLDFCPLVCIWMANNYTLTSYFSRKALLIYSFSHKVYKKISLHPHQHCLLFIMVIRSCSLVIERIEMQR